MILRALSSNLKNKFLNKLVLTNRRFQLFLKYPNKSSVCLTSDLFSNFQQLTINNEFKSNQKNDQNRYESLKKTLIISSLCAIAIVTSTNEAHCESNKSHFESDSCKNSVLIVV